MGYFVLRVITAEGQHYGVAWRHGRAQRLPEHKKPGSWPHHDVTIESLAYKFMPKIRGHYRSVPCQDLVSPPNSPPHTILLANTHHLSPGYNIRTVLVCYLIGGRK